MRMRESLWTNPHLQHTSSSICNYTFFLLFTLAALSNRNTDVLPTTVFIFSPQSPNSPGPSLLGTLGSAHSILELGVRVLLLHRAVHLHHLLVPRLEGRGELALTTSLLTSLASTSVHLACSGHLFWFIMRKFEPAPRDQTVADYQQCLPLVHTANPFLSDIVFPTPHPPVP